MTTYHVTNLPHLDVVFRIDNRFAGIHVEM